MNSKLQTQPEDISAIDRIEESLVDEEFEEMKGEIQRATREAEELKAELAKQSSAKKKNPIATNNESPMQKSLLSSGKRGISSPQNQSQSVLQMPKANKFEEQRKSELMTLSPKAQSVAVLSPKVKMKSESIQEKENGQSKSKATKETPGKERAEKNKGQIRLETSPGLPLNIYKATGRSPAHTHVGSPGGLKKTDQSMQKIPSALHQSMAQVRPVSALNKGELLNRSQFRITNLERSIRQDAARSEAMDMLRATGDYKQSQKNVSNSFF